MANQSRPSTRYMRVSFCPRAPTLVCALARSCRKSVLVHETSSRHSHAPAQWVRTTLRKRTPMRLCVCLLDANLVPALAGRRPLLRRLNLDRTLPRHLNLDRVPPRHVSSGGSTRFQIYFRRSSGRLSIGWQPLTLSCWRITCARAHQEGVCFSILQAPAAQLGWSGHPLTGVLRF